MRAILNYFSGLTAAVFCSVAIFSTGQTYAASMVALREVASGFVSPVVLCNFPSESGANLIVDQAGTISILGADGKLGEVPFLDVRSKLVKLNSGFDERGLLGLALHPKFKQNRKLYVVYSAPLRSGGPAEWDSTLQLSEFTVAKNNPRQVDLASERLLLGIDKPYANHNGGCLAFGPEGYLYMSVGDGGNTSGIGRGHAAIGNGQDMTTLLGKFVRIDVNSGNPYSSPSDNPLVKGSGRPEIFASGFRNPWRFSFDRGGKHQLFVGDVGQGAFEEVDIVVKGGNYGWNAREGFHPFNPKDATKVPEETPGVSGNLPVFKDPIFESKNFGVHKKDPDSKGISITGGYIYRGKALRHLQGKYIFGDWSRLWIKPDGVLYAATAPSAVGSQWTIETLETKGSKNNSLGAYLVALGEDADGELYVMTNASNSLIGKTGKVWKIVSE